MFSDQRDQSRQVFFTTWKKYQIKIPLTPLEKEVLSIILLHPEYHHILSNPEAFKNEDFDQNNPFLHMGLHLALHEQISTNRPPGIQTIYHQLCEQYHDVHVVAHSMIDVLAHVLWEAQKTQKMPAEATYVAELNALLVKK